MYISIYVIEDSSVSDMLLQLPQLPKQYNTKELKPNWYEVRSAWAI